MKTKTITARYIAFRYCLPHDRVYCITTSKRPRAFVQSGHGNVTLTRAAVGSRWLEVPLSEALNDIAASGAYTMDTRHPLVFAFLNMANQGFVAAGGIAGETMEALTRL